MFDNEYREAKFRLVMLSVFFRFIFLCLSLFMLVGCATFGGTLHTKVVGTGNAVVLTWDEQHPLARQLQSDSNIRLRADYRVGGRLMSEVLASSRGKAGRSVTFVLPSRLKKGDIPDGEICLYIQPSTRGIPILPIRAVSSSQVDTGGFRYLTWEASLKENMQEQRSEHMLSTLERELKSIQTRVSNSEQMLLKKGVKKLEDCFQITQQPMEVERPFDVVEIGQQDAVTRKICIRKARNDNKNWMLVDIPNLISDYMAGSTVLLARRDHAKIFLRDWNIWFSSVGVEYQPEIGTADDGLPIVTTARDLIRALKEGHALNKSGLIALAGAVLDAYDGCIEDTRKQLMTKLIAWQQQVQSKPERDRKYIEYVRQECQKEVEDNQKLMTRAKELQQNIESHTSEVVRPRATLSEHSQELNLQACGV